MSALTGERRLVLRILERWESLRNERPFPALSDIESTKFGDDWENCFLVSVGPALAEHFFSYVGEDLSVPVWSEAAGRAVADCPENTLLRHAAGFIDRVLERRIPISFGGDFCDGDDKILYRSIILPLSDDGRRVDSLLGAANSRPLGGAGVLASEANSQPA